MADEVTAKRQALVICVALTGSLVLFLGVASIFWKPLTWNVDHGGGVGPPSSVELERPWPSVPGGGLSQDDQMSPIHVTVELKGDQSKLPASARVYVMVRPVNSRMPLGVERYAPSELPKLVAFTPKPGVGGDVEVVARLSMSGRVEPSTDDVEDRSAPMRFEADDQGVSLLLEVPTGEISVRGPH